MKPRLLLGTTIFAIALSMGPAAWAKPKYDATDEDVRVKAEATPKRPEPQRPTRQPRAEPRPQHFELPKPSFKPSYRPERREMRRDERQDQRIVSPKPTYTRPAPMSAPRVRLDDNRHVNSTFNTPKRNDVRMDHRETNRNDPQHDRRYDRHEDRREDRRDDRRHDRRDDHKPYNRYDTHKNDRHTNRGTRYYYTYPYTGSTYLYWYDDPYYFRFNGEPLPYYGHPGLRMTFSSGYGYQPSYDLYPWWYGNEGWGYRTLQGYQPGYGHVGHSNVYCTDPTHPLYPIDWDRNTRNVSYFTQYSDLTDGAHGGYDIRDCHMENGRGLFANRPAAVRETVCWDQHAQAYVPTGAVQLIQYLQ